MFKKSRRASLLMLKKKKGLLMLDGNFGKVVYPGKKYRGKIIQDIPSNYLKWVAENYSDDSIASAADKEWHFRERFNNHWEDD